MWSKRLAIKDTMGPSGGCQTRFRTRVSELGGWCTSSWRSLQRDQDGGSGAAAFTLSESLSCRPLLSVQAEHAHWRPWVVAWVSLTSQGNGAGGLMTYSTFKTVEVKVRPSSTGCPDRTHSHPLCALARGSPSWVLCIARTPGWTTQLGLEDSIENTYGTKSSP